jgi:Raf kinase inhibitor-like YbhB/YbcL family protein
MEAAMTNRADNASGMVVRYVKCACLALAVYLLAAALNASYVGAQTSAKSASGFKLETTAFKPGGDIPAKYTCSGEDISPALTWTDPPAGTNGFALIVEDPDAPGGTFTHWVIIGMKAEARELPEAINKTGNILQGDPRKGAGGMQITNDFGRTGYNGPCPPPGRPHRYFFKLYALDSPLSFRAGRADTRHAVDQAMKGHILAEAEVMGRYQRQ